MNGLLNTIDRERKRIKESKDEKKEDQPKENRNSHFKSLEPRPTP